MSKVDCSKVIVATSKFSTFENQFDGAFAKVDIKKGELVEKGIMRRLSGNQNEEFYGMNNPFVFTWSDDKPNNSLAFASVVIICLCITKEDIKLLINAFLCDEVLFSLFILRPCLI